MKSFAFLSPVDSNWADGHFLVRLGDGGQIEMIPTTLAEQLACEIILVQALHDQNDRSVALVVETGHQRVGEPLVDVAATDL